MNWPHLPQLLQLQPQVPLAWRLRVNSGQHRRPSFQHTAAPAFSTVLCAGSVPLLDRP